MERIKPWWGEFSLLEGEGGCWSVGTSRIWIEHHPREWRIAWLGGTDSADATSAVALSLPLGQAAPEAAIARYSFGEMGPHLKVLPLLADRPVISRPDVPLFIPPAQTIQLYISSPLWMQVRAGTQEVLLQEMPLQRPSDTWSGPLTREGGLCYASSTMARTTLEDFPFSPLRAVTPIRITNRAEDTVPVERLSLPVPFLSLFQAEDGVLWTQAVELERRGGEALELVQLGSAAPAEAGNSTLLAGARRKADRSVLGKAFGTLFGLGGSDDGAD